MTRKLGETDQEFSMRMLAEKQDRLYSRSLQDFLSKLGLKTTKTLTIKFATYFRAGDHITISGGTTWTAPVSGTYTISSVGIDRIDSGGVEDNGTE